MVGDVASFNIRAAGVNLIAFASMSVASTSMSISFKPTLGIVMDE